MVAAVLTAVDVILPVLDERAALPDVLAGLPDGVRAIVVDNGSSDGSADLARGLGATVVDAPVRGFGSACWAGLVVAEAPVVAFCDCDGSLDLAELGLVTGPVLAGAADLVLAARRPEGRGAWPIHARMANLVLAAEVRRRTGVRLRDIGPMRAAGREALLGLQLKDRRSGWPLEMVLRAAAAGWRIAEVEVAYRPRLGRSKVTGTVTGTVRAVKDMASALR